MTFTLSTRSRAKLFGVHPDLVAVVERGITYSPFEFMVLEGLRTKERQAELVRIGASRTLNSRHLSGHAVDIAPVIDGKVSWAWPLYWKLNDAMQRAATELNIPITWGGRWQTFPDGAHFELPWDRYPLANEAKT